MSSEEHGSIAYVQSTKSTIECFNAAVVAITPVSDLILTASASHKKQIGFSSHGISFHLSNDNKLPVAVTILSSTRYVA